MGSKPFSLAVFDWGKIGRGALVALAGLFLTYIIPTVTGLTYVINLPGGALDLTPFAIVFWQVVANIARKFVSDTTNSI